jgi:hypothetical protein
LSAALADDTLTLEPMARLSDVIITAITSTRPGPQLLPRWSGHPALTTEIALTLGAASKPRVAIKGDSAVAATILRGLAKATTEDSSAAGSQRVRLRLSLSPDSTGVTMPLVAARQLSVQGTAPRQHPGFGAPPYPRTRSRVEAQAVVLAWYVVDARGSFVPDSFGAAPAADPAVADRYADFVAAVRQGALRARHDPATAGGCPVPRRSVLRVEFNVGEWQH